jgi:molecular chaperone DnaK (HSP70)
MSIRLGIDFGTTHTVVASVDRGNFPIVSFHDDGGTTTEWYPSLVAYKDGEWRFGMSAAAVSHKIEWSVCRSFKRFLADCEPDFQLRLGGGEISIIELLSRYLSALKSDLISRSNLDVEKAEVFEVMISVPANANNNQRFLTTEGFRLAGFDVLGVINEPTAAGVEYVHRFGVKGARSRKHYLLVFDLGGGTFDVSVIGIGMHQYETLATEGIMRLGGDDFDQLLFNLAIQKSDLKGDLTQAQKVRLLQECREKKESLHPNTRKISIDLEQAIPGAGDVNVAVADFYQVCGPLVDQTIEIVNRALASAAKNVGVNVEKIASLYIVGGGSHFPLVNRKLREMFKHLVKRSSYPHGAAAVGLAIASDKDYKVELKEQFTRDFGVWRENSAGKEIVLDRLFAKGTQLPAIGEEPIIVKRSYAPTHNIGYFRYFECGRLNDSGKPADDLSVLKEIRFPFDHALQGEINLTEIEIGRLDQPATHTVDETYHCTDSGMVQLTIRDTSNGYEQSYLLVGNN